MTSRDIELVTKLIKAALEKAGIKIEIDFNSVIKEHEELVDYWDHQLYDEHIKDREI